MSLEGFETADLLVVVSVWLEDGLNVLELLVQIVFVTDLKGSANEGAVDRGLDG